MIRTQIQLSEAQARRLKALAAERGVSVAELIRQGVDTLIPAGAVDGEERRQRAMAAAGRFHSGQHDVSVQHDRHLAEVWKR